MAAAASSAAVAVKRVLDPMIRPVAVPIAGCESVAETTGEFVVMDDREEVEDEADGAIEITESDVVEGDDAGDDNGKGPTPGFVDDGSNVSFVVVVVAVVARAF